MAKPVRGQRAVPKEPEAEQPPAAATDVREVQGEAVIFCLGQVTWPAMVVRAHDDQVLDLVVFHAPGPGSALECVSFYGRIGRKRDGVPVLPGVPTWRPRQ